VSKANMKKSIIIIIILTSFASCKKESVHPVITGTVQQEGGCSPGTWLVHITGTHKYAFLCESSSSFSSFNCTNSVYIINMPASFSQLGKRIKFSKWKDIGGSCLSSSFAPHLIEVSDLSAE
jgi:hypothetical protein